jgi:hypothetical protein
MKKIVLFFCLVGVATSIAQETRFESGARQTALIELYTSEGCSSCPPAEAWLSKLKSDSGLWKDFVPLAFHVDYWDRLGWRDRFASRQWTERQNSYASLLRQSSVYTPEFVRNGAEWSDWLGNTRVKVSDSEKTGVLSATTSDNKTFVISFRSNDHTDLEAHAALLGCGISSRIGAGENSGRQLQHDFVVLNQQSQIMRAEGDSSRRATFTFGSLNNDIPQKAIAVWITRAKQMVPLQATGGWLGKIASGK